ncbi:MAG TPA: ComF family protein [Mycobacteriales bacterium]|nr:ComF family protein [Mycobacteriales bacterium]
MNALLDLVFPVQCAGCGARSVPICADCVNPLLAQARVVWPRPAPAGLPPPYAVAAYEGSVRAMLLAVKEHGVAVAQRPLGRALAGAVAAAVPDRVAAVCLVPVPSSRAARRRRGEDVVRRLATLAAADLKRAGVAVSVAPVLRHARAVTDSAGLGAEARARNLADAFVARPRLAVRLRDRPVVLVDDLITTGATLAECSAALTAAGVRVAACATVAATQRHGPRGSAQQALRGLPSQDHVPATDGRDPAWTSS